MKLTLRKEKIEFDFPDADELFKFDDDDKNSKYYHGISHCMKAVDVVAVFSKYQLWIEIKEFPQDVISEFAKKPDDKGSKKNKSLSEYESDLKQKFRDTYLYRHCEGKDNLPIAYVFLTNLPDDLCQHCIQVLERDIPVGYPNPIRWKKTLLDENQLYVVNFNNWANHFNTFFGTCTRLP